MRSTLLARIKTRGPSLLRIFQFWLIMLCIQRTRGCCSCVWMDGWPEIDLCGWLRFGYYSRQPRLSEPIVLGPLWLYLEFRPCWHLETHWWRTRWTNKRRNNVKVVLNGREMRLNSPFCWFSRICLKITNYSFSAVISQSSLPREPEGTGIREEIEHELSSCLCTNGFHNYW